MLRRRGLSSTILTWVALSLPAGPALAKRVALFIGNQAYTHERVLTNPVNDVDLLGKLFKDELKFDSVVLRTNLKADDIDRGVIALQSRLKAQMPRCSITQAMA